MGFYLKAKSFISFLALKFGMPGEVVISRNVFYLGDGQETYVVKELVEVKLPPFGDCILTVTSQELAHAVIGSIKVYSKWNLILDEKVRAYDIELLMMIEERSEEVAREYFFLFFMKKEIIYEETFTFFPKKVIIVCKETKGKENVHY